MPEYPLYHGSAVTALKVNLRTTVVRIPFISFWRIGSSSKEVGATLELEEDRILLRGRIPRT